MRIAAVAAAALLFTGCYHATIDTGLQPSGQKIEKPWAHGFVYGLVPPSTVETASKCPNGVAKVETKHTFVNQLATFLTWGLYTPINITVECAAAGRPAPTDGETLSVPQDADANEVAKVFDDAAKLSIEKDQPVWVSFE